jgi:hypothetical protein
MNKTAKILIASAFALVVGIAAIAKIQATAQQAAPPPVAVQPTEWWEINYRGECERASFSPAALYEDLVKHHPEGGISLTDKNDRVEIFKYGTSSFFKGEAACKVEHDKQQMAKEEARRAAELVAETKKRKLDQFLAPYR